MFKIQCDLFIENSSCCFCTQLKLSIKKHVNFLTALHTADGQIFFFIGLFLQIAQHSHL